MPPELLKIDRKLVEDQLERILASKIFRPAARSRAFLRYLVEQSLAEEWCKEYTIATEVLGRSADYDPAVDATVRVEAGRLRQRLREYYETEGKNDPVTIEIPKGGYAAVFTTRVAEASPQVSGLPIAPLSAAPEQAEPNSAPGRAREETVDIPLQGSSASPAGQQREAAPGRWAHQGRLAAGAAVLAIVSTIVGFWAIERSRHPGSSIRPLAVIPLENLSGDPGQEYFADGMTDELITMLAKNSSLRLVSRTSTMQYKGARRPLPEIARTLGVDGILEGSISRTGDKVHMNVQLIQAASDTHMWAESYDRSTKDLPSLSRDAALAIAAQVHRSAPHTAAQRYVSPEAHDASPRGRYYWFSQDGVKSSEYLKKATELQPDYAAAWSGLANAYILSAVNGNGLSSHFAPLAEQAASRALALDNSLPDAYFAKAGIALLFRWAPEQSLKEFDRTLALDPQWGEAYFERSLALEAVNRMDEALDETKRGADLDPFGRSFSVPQVLFRMRNYDAAIREAQVRLQAQPTDTQLLWNLTSIYHCKGMDVEAAQEWEKAALYSDGEAEAAAVHRASEQGGYKAILERQLDELKKQATHEYVTPLNLAGTYAALGRKEEALYYAEQAYQEHAPALIWIQTWPEWDFLHSDERYRSIVRRMGLPPAW